MNGSKAKDDQEETVANPKDIAHHKSLPIITPKKGLRAKVLFDEGIFGGVVWEVEKRSELLNGKPSWDVLLLYDDGEEDVIVYPDEKNEVWILGNEGEDLRPSLKYMARQRVTQLTPGIFLTRTFLCDCVP